MAPEVLHHLAPTLPTALLNSAPLSYSNSHSSHAGLLAAPTLDNLNLHSPQFGDCSQISIWLPFSPPLVLNSNATFSVRPSLTPFLILKPSPPNTLYSALHA